MLLALSGFWGGSFFFVAIAVDELPPITTASLRIGLAALAMNLLLRAMKINIPSAPALWHDFLIMGLLNLAIPFALIAWGQTRIDSGLASIFNATTPFSTTIVAHFFTHDERMTRSRMVGVGIAFAGAVLIIGINVLEGLGSAFAGELAVLAATWSYAFAAVFGHRFSGPRFKAIGISPLVASTGQLTGATLLIVPFALAMEHPWTLPLPGWETGAAVAGMSLLSAALVTLLMPATALLLGVTVLGERLDPRYFIGVALLAAGLAVVDGRVMPVRARGLRSDAYQERSS